MVAAGVGDGAGVEVREPRAELLAQLRHRQRALVEQLPGGTEHGSEVDATKGRAEHGVAGELAVEHRLDERPQAQAVVGAEQVHRRPHGRDPHGAALDEELAQLVGLEALES